MKLHQLSFCRFAEHNISSQPEHFQNLKQQDSSHIDQLIFFQFLTELVLKLAPSNNKPFFWCLSPLNPFLRSGSVQHYWNEIFYFVHHLAHKFIRYIRPHGNTRFKKKTKYNMFGPHTCLCFFFSLQSSAADVFYCVFNRWNDSNGTDRRQVRTTALRLYLFLSCLFYFLNCFHLPRRDRIRAGLEQLRMVQPGGDTYMHRGFQRVSHLFLQWETHNVEPNSFKFIDTDAWKTFPSGQRANILRDRKRWVFFLI